MWISKMRWRLIITFWRRPSCLNPIPSKIICTVTWPNKLSGLRMVVAESVRCLWRFSSWKLPAATRCSYRIQIRSLMSQASMLIAKYRFSGAAEALTGIPSRRWLPLSMLTRLKAGMGLVVRALGTRAFSTLITRSRSERRCLQKRLFSRLSTTRVSYIRLAATMVTIKSN